MKEEEKGEGDDGEYDEWGNWLSSKVRQKVQQRNGRQHVVVG